MTMYRISPTAVKIHMTGAELRAYRVTLDQFGQNEPAVMRLLEDLVAAAVRRRRRRIGNVPGSVPEAGA